MNYTHIVLWRFELASRPNGSLRYESRALLLSPFGVKESYGSLSRVDVFFLQDPFIPAFFIHRIHSTQAVFCRFLRLPSPTASSFSLSSSSSADPPPALSSPDSSSSRATWQAAHIPSSDVIIGHCRPSCPPSALHDFLPQVPWHCLRMTRPSEPAKSQCSAQ